MGLELPEALIIARQIREALAGHTIQSVYRDFERAMVVQGYTNVQDFALVKRRIEHVYVRGRWIFFRLSPGNLLLMLSPQGGGHIRLYDDDPSTPYHFRLDFDNDHSLTVFLELPGFVRAGLDIQAKRDPYPGRQGLMPQEMSFSYTVFYSLLGRRKQAIYTVLTDQYSMAGLGPHYAQDILFRAGLHPARQAITLDDTERRHLYNILRHTINKAIQQGGRSTQTDLYGQAGRYEVAMGPHLSGKSCPACGGPTQDITILETVLTICPREQPEE